MVIQSISVLAYFTIYLLMPILEISFCTYIKACVADYKVIMNNVGEHIKKNYEKENDFRINDASIRNSFKDAVRLHVEMLR